MDVLNLEENNPPVRTDLPILVHPLSVSTRPGRLNKQGTLGVSVLAAGREALRAVNDAWARINDAETLMHAAAKPVTRHQNASNDPHHKMTRLTTDYSDVSNVRMIDGSPTVNVSRDDFVKAANETFERTARVVDRRALEIKGLHKLLSDKVATALDDPNGRTPLGIAQGQEIRAHVKSLSAKQRVVFLHQIVELGDKPTINALLTAAPFLSGISLDDQLQIRSNASQKFAPVEYEQQLETERVLEAVHNAGSAFLGRVTKVHNLANTAAAKVDKAIADLAKAK